MNKTSRIFVAGYRGLVGSAITRRLQADGFKNLILKSRNELNLLDINAVERFFSEEKPEYVFMAAAKVGGIGANDAYPADFIYENLSVQTNIIHQSYVHNVKKLLFLGSSCIYPKQCPQPIKEEYLLSGYLEATNEPYAIAKIAGISMCQSYNKQYGTNFISAMPTNLYGINDNFHPENSHVVAALLRKFHEKKVAGEKKVTIWGTGTPKREFFYVEDLADACLFLMKNYDDSEIINVGTGKETTIKELAETISEIVDYDFEMVFDPSRPDGTLEKIMDVSRINELGWTAKTSLKEGLTIVYEWFAKNFRDNI